MADITPQDMAAKLLASSFERVGPSVTALTDPIADTPMVVTLEQLRPYDHDPRVTRNPAFDEIKASIRERGLDAPPAITRRPTEPHYRIRNGGNTRLAILGELWTETKDERFFRVPCLFRPWPSRGEVVVLTGHLAENELRGGLTFIERALGVEKAREFYELEIGHPLSQSELSRRLAADGYPVQQSHISRMSDAVRFLLPAIPSVLYGGLGRHQVERLAVLRKACERAWERRALSQKSTMDFGSLFQDVLSQFDLGPAEFSPQRVQDELVGLMAEFLQVDYDTLALEVSEGESRQRALTNDPKLSISANSPATGRQAIAAPRPAISPPLPTATAAAELRTGEPSASGARRAGQDQEVGSPAPRCDDRGLDERKQAHIVSPASTTERLQSIQRLVADHLGDTRPEFEDNVLRAIPVQVGGLYPITDVWYIEPGLDSPEHLRTHIGQFAREIAEEAAVAGRVEVVASGLGFFLAAPANDQVCSPSKLADTVTALLEALSATPASDASPDRPSLEDIFGCLLQSSGQSSPRLSDEGLVKLFRLLRLARRLLDLEATAAQAT